MAELWLNCPLPAPTPGIRLALRRDMPGVVRLLSKVFSNKTFDADAFFMDFDRTWIVDSADRLIATISLRIEEEYVQLHWLAVDPDERGRGWGRQLIGVVLAEARALGHKRVVVKLNPANPVAEKVYRECGFQTLGKDPSPVRSRNSD